MVLRDVIGSLAKGDGGSREALADAGFDGVAPELIGQALASYADTATMEEADALSPIVLRTMGPEDGIGEDVYEALDAIPPPEAAEVDDAVDTDDDGLDDGEADDAPAFGEGADPADDADDSVDDGLDQADDAVDDAIDQVDDGLAQAGLDDPGDVAADLAIDDPTIDEFTELDEADSGLTDDLDDFLDGLGETTDVDPDDLDLDG